MDQFARKTCMKRGSRRSRNSFFWKSVEVSVSSGSKSSPASQSIAALRIVLSDARLSYSLSSIIVSPTPTLPITNSSSMS